MDLHRMLAELRAERESVEMGNQISCINEGYTPALCY
jgi:hypothetical protein